MVYKCVIDEFVVDANIICTTTDQKELAFISFFSTPSRSKILIRKLKNRTSISLSTRGGRKITSLPKTLEVISSRIPSYDYTHVIAYQKDKVSTENDREKLKAYIFSKSSVAYGYQTFVQNTLPQELLDQVYEKLYNHTPIPLLREWMPYIVDSLWKQSFLSTLCIHKSSDTNFTALVLNIEFLSLIDIIKTGFETGAISIGNSANASSTMRNMQGLNNYLASFSGILAQKIKNQIRPKFIPGEDKYSSSLEQFADCAKYFGNVNLYDAQKAGIEAAARTLSQCKSTIIVGEMGSGKTVMGIGSLVTHLEKKQGSTIIILLPSLLKRKWVKEITKYAPHSTCKIINSLKDLKKAETQILDKTRRKNLWLILSKETAKLSYDIRPAVLWSPRTSKRHIPCYVCPECGQPLFKWETMGKGGNKRQVCRYLTERDFLNPNAYNLTCANLVKKKHWNSAEKRWTVAAQWKRPDGQVWKSGDVCGAKLWTPVIADASSTWIKLSESGWIERARCEPLFNDLSGRSNLSKEDTRLLSSLSSVLSQEKIVQRAPRRFPISKYILRYLKKDIDYLITDELHQYLAADSAQAEAFGDIFQASKKFIGLTGTLMNGYAKGIFPLLFRITPGLMRKEGFSYGDMEAFAKEYGVIRKIKTVNIRNHKPVGNIKSKHLPGISPLLYTKFLLDNTIFISLSDIAEGLPSYTEHPVAIQMDNELRRAYQSFESDIRENFRAYDSNNYRIMAQMVQALMVYPDQPYKQPPILNPETGTILALPQELEQCQRGKDHAVLKLIKNKVACGEKVLFYYHWSNRTDIAIRRMKNLLEKEGIAAAVLSSRIKAENREEWIREQLDHGIDVLLTNDSLVEVGLDLLDFTTIINYQISSSLFTMQQANRRSWRLSQTKDVNVYFFYYAATAQENALALMAGKLNAAMMMSGKFDEEGLRSMAQSDDLLTQIATDVVGGIKKNVDMNVFSKMSHTAVSKRTHSSPNLRLKAMIELERRYRFPRLKANPQNTIHSNELNFIKNPHSIVNL